MKKKCISCGTILNERSHFCDVCGTYQNSQNSLQNSNNYHQSANFSNNYSNMKQSNKKHKNKTTLVLIIASTLILVLIVLLIALLLIKTPSDKEAEETVRYPQEINVEEFCEKYQGVWVYLENMKSSYEFYAIQDKMFFGGVYCGPTDRKGEITGVQLIEENTYQLTIFYPYENSMEFGELEEETLNTTIKIENGDRETLSFESDNYKNKLEHMGLTFEEASTNVGIYIRNEKLRSYNIDTGYEAYDEKVLEYAEALTMGEDSFHAKYNDLETINTMIINYCYYYDTQIGYSLYDVDGNGTPELLFSDFKTIIDIYTINNWKLVTLFESPYFGDRSRLHILSSGQLLNEGANSAFSSSCTLMELSSDRTSVIPVESYYFYEGPDDDPYSEYTDEILLTVDEYNKKIDSWLINSAFTKVSWTKLYK